MSINYDSIGNNITMRASIKDLSNRDKCSLFNALMDDLGLTKRIQDEPDVTAGFQYIWAEIMMDKWSD